MSWQIILLCGSLLAGGLGVLLFTWRSDIKKNMMANIENDSNKAALNDIGKTSEKEKKVRDRYNELRDHATGRQLLIQAADQAAAKPKTDL